MVGIAVLALAGCGAPQTKPPAVAAGPAAELNAAVAKLGTESAAFTLAFNGRTEEGVVEAGTGDWEITTGTIVMRRIGSDLYTTAAAGHDLDPKPLSWHPGDWLHYTVRDREVQVTLKQGFPWTPARAAATGTQVIRSGGNSFVVRGLPTASAGRSSSPGELFLTADLDSAGRVAKVSATSMLSPPDPYAMTVTYHDYGKQVDVVAPGGHIIEDDFLGSITQPII